MFLTHIVIACVLGVFVGKLILFICFCTLAHINIGGLYFKTGDSIAGFQSRIGCLFFLVCIPECGLIIRLSLYLQGALIAFSTLSALYNLVEIRPLFLRERAAGYYRYISSFLSSCSFSLTFTFHLVPQHGSFRELSST